MQRAGEQQGAQEWGAVNVPAAVPADTAKKFVFLGSAQKSVKQSGVFFVADLVTLILLLFGE